MSGLNNSELRQRINMMEQIPANEQYIGHFQMAVIQLLNELLDRIEKLQKLNGVFHG